MSREGGVAAEAPGGPLAFRSAAFQSRALPQMKLAWIPSAAAGGANGRSSG
jgi:hypothetical protein